MTLTFAPMTLILDLDLGILKVYLHTKNKASKGWNLESIASDNVVIDYLLLLCVCM